METKVILDTSILVDFIRNKQDAVSFVKRLSESHEVCTTDINVFELYYGAYLSNQPEKNTATVKGLLDTLLIFSVTSKSAEISGKMLAELDKQGQKIEIKDILVAGICLANSCPIATGNKKHFERMKVKIFEESVKNQKYNSLMDLQGIAEGKASLEEIESAEAEAAHERFGKTKRNSKKTEK